MVAGVCGGVAHALGIDPIVLRVAVAVLTFFGGAGIVVYVAGWLLMPDGTEEQSLAQRAFGGRIGGNRANWLLAGLLVLATGITLHAVFGSHYGFWHPAVVLLVIGAVLYARRRSRSNNTWPTPAPPAATTSTPPPGLPATEAWARAPSPASTVPVPPPAARPVRSRLGTTTFFVILLALGVLAAIDALGADVPLPAYPATVVAGAGLGLLIGTWYGRARGLIALGLLGLLALPPTAFAQEFHGGFVHGTRTIVPTTSSELLPSYDFRGGEVRLDLSRLDLAGQDARSTVHLGAGELVVTVPRTADVTLHLRLSAGQYETFDAQDGGIDLVRTVQDQGPDGPGGGALELTIRQGVGHLEVRRAEASTPTEDPRATA